MSARWFRIAVSDGATVTLAAAEAEHAGAAIAAVVARVGGKRRVWPVAAAAVDGAAPLGEAVGRGVVVLPDPPALPPFEYPPGVVPTLGERTRAAVEVGQRRLRDGDTHVIEVVAAGANAAEIFLDVIERLPTVDNIEVEVAEHLDPPGQRQVWLTPRLRDLRRAIRFLDDLEDELLASGHVDVAAYVRAPRSTWRLTQHKTLLWLSDDEALTERVAGWLARHDLPALEPLATVATGPHLHYRGPRSSPRGRLLDRLKKAGLRRIELPAS